MTQNQIAYWNLEEQKRTNRANESIKTADVSEKVRSNKSNENIKRDTLYETQRSNIANEGIKRDTLKETERHNRHGEAAGYINSAANVVKALPGVSKATNLIDGLI